MFNNIFYNNGSGSQINDNESKVGSVWDYNLHSPDFNWPPKQPEFDQHSLFGVDPRFRNVGASNYHLRTDSPAIDRGMALTGFNYDKEFVFRPQIAAWDIGPYEAVPELELVGLAANTAIHLAWTVNVTLPLTTTWTIDYEGERIASSESAKGMALSDFLVRHRASQLPPAILVRTPRRPGT